MRTLTYGTLPSFAEFADAVTEATGHTGLYEINCPPNGTDSRMLNDLGLFELGGRYLDDNEGVWMGLNRKQLYALLESLVAHHDRVGIRDWGVASEGESEWAGDFASSILATLGFEWV